MREIKFRGKKLYGTEWIYGCFYKSKSSESGVVVNGIPVDPKTVGQYTGMKDKNGVEIYEGQEVMYDYEGISIASLNIEIKKTKCEIAFYEGQFCVEYLGCYYILESEKIEVIV